MLVLCDISHFSQQKQLPYSLCNFSFELLQFDIWDHISIPSVHGHIYFLTILDDHSRYVWIILLKSKYEVSNHAKNFITKIHTHYHITPKFVRSDNAIEFMLHDFYASQGITQHKFCVETIHTIEEMRGNINISKCGKRYFIAVQITMLILVIYYVTCSFPYQLCHISSPSP